MLEISGASSLAAMIRILDVAPAGQASAFADGCSPRWPEEIFRVVQEERLVTPDEGFLMRLASAMVQLPRSTPRPHLGLGVDGSIALEWNLGGLHLGIQIDPDEECDAAFVDSPGDGAIVEVPLPDGLDVIALFFAHQGSGSSW